MLSYRLGNTLNIWFSMAHVHIPFDNIETMNSDYDNTFASFLTSYPVKYRYMGEDVSFLNDYWFAKLDLLKMVYNEFRKSTWHAINDYFRPVNMFTDTNTCVIHLRLGDFLVTEKQFPYSSLINALDSLPQKPTTIQILGGGKTHFHPGPSGIIPDIVKKSEHIYDILKSETQKKFPESHVEIIYETDPDNDFYRMVHAPMLVTGIGSFAILAAMLNNNFRLIPALGDLSHVFADYREPEKLDTGFYTYKV